MIAKTSVSEVQVYRSSATVTRFGTVELKAGRNILFVSGMTATAVSDSFKLKFPEKVRAVNIQIVDINAGGIEEEKESDVIRKKLAEVSYQIETCNMMLELRKKNADFSNRTNISIEAQEKLMTALPEQLAVIHKQLDAFTEEEAKLKSELDKVLAEESKPLIMAELFADEDMTAQFILQYQESGSSWIPKYEIEYTDDQKPLNVSMKAQIRQSSGEDWKQIKVTLYTGNPTTSKDIPVLPRVEISLYEPPKAVRSNAKGMVAMSAPMASGEVMMGQTMMMNMAAADTAVLKTETAEVSEEETMTAYVLPNLRDVLSDTDGNVADLQSYTVNAQYNVLSIPSMDDKCYLTAEVAASEWPLPPANASVYLKDTFAGMVFVDPLADAEKLTISLGQDERINVVRTESPRKSQDVFLKNIRKQSCKTVMKVTNSSSEEVGLVIKDLLPVSTDKQIVIDTVNLSGGILDEETGEVKWEIKAEPAKTENLELEYNISWPKDKRITERRVGGSTGKKFCHVCGAQVFGKFCPECGSVAP